MAEDGPVHIRKSNIRGVTWPPMLAGNAASLAVLLAELETTQWLAPAALARLQARQLPTVLNHAAAQSPAFAARLKSAGLAVRDIDTPETLRRLKPIGKPEIQEAGADFFARSLPPGHEPVADAETSGSTGQPIVIRRTAVNHLFWAAYAIRDHAWNRRDLTGRLSAVRGTIAAYGTAENWGIPTKQLFVTGKLQAIPITTDLAIQNRYLTEFQPTVLKVYPSNLAGLLQIWQASGVPLRELRHITCMGETVSEALRSDAREITGLEIEDHYSSQEVGSIAIQCPAGGQYHLMAESLIVEVLDAADRPCAAGEIGRVVVSDLHNLASPMIRYDLGDHAEVGGPCPCGRGLPTLKRILGRTRNLLRRPDGVSHWPHTGWRDFVKVAPVRQYQLVQTTLHDIEVRLVTDSELGPEQIAAIGPRIQAALGYPFTLTFVQSRQRLPLGRNGKFEEFMSLLPA